jgi:hypothetical protein
MIFFKRNNADICYDRKINYDAKKHKLRLSLKNMKIVKHKFHAKPEVVDDMHFSSKLEASYYKYLKILQKNGDVVFFLRQVPFQLPGNTKYVVDFVQFMNDGTVLFVDCKGLETEIFKLKKRQVEELYPITITIVRSV